MWETFVWWIVFVCMYDSCMYVGLCVGNDTICLNVCTVLHDLSFSQGRWKTCYSGYFWHAWLWPAKTILPACRKFNVYLHVKNHIYLSPLSWNITNILQTGYLEYMGHTWPRPSKAISATCRKIWCLSANKKSTWSLNCFRDIIP